MKLSACLSGAVEVPQGGEGGGGARALSFALERDRVEGPGGTAGAVGAAGAAGSGAVGVSLVCVDIFGGVER